MYKSFIFDFDGTLFDTEQGVVDALFYSHEMFFPKQDRSHINKATLRKAKSYNDQFYLAVKNNKIPKEFIQEAESFYIKNIGGIQPMPYAVDLISFIDEHKMPFAIVSNKKAKLINEIIRSNDFLKNCKAIIACEGDIPQKPSPKGVILAIKYLESPILLIGDSDNDAIAANRAKVDSAIIGESGFAKYNIKNLLELKNIIFNNEKT